jgi:hypothetical protein
MARARGPRKKSCSGIGAAQGANGTTEAPLQCQTAREWGHVGGELERVDVRVG